MHAHIHVCDFITILGFGIFFHLLSKKVLYNYSYRYWCLILLKYRYVLITMLFSIEFNKVFVFLHNCLTFHQCLEWSNSYNGTWSPKILQLSLSEDALDIYLRLTTIVCDDQYYMYIFVHVVFINKMCSIGYNHDINDKKTFLNMTV